jgi:hypothetical protein
MPNQQGFPLSLYKFRVLDKQSHEELLTSNLLSFPSPDKFNDPFDCKIPIRYDRGRNEEIKHYWERHIRITRHDLNRRERRKLARDTCRKIRQMPEKTVEIQEGIIDAAIGIFSLSANHKSILLWAHYANAHESKR